VCVCVCDPRPRQCFLRLAPYVECGTTAFGALSALAAVTFVVFGLGFPALCGWLLWHGSASGRGGWLGASGAADFLLEPLRASWWRALWAGPVAFGRRLLFAALVGGSSYSTADASLPVLVFASLLLLLLLQVSPLLPAALLARRSRALDRGAQIVCQPYASSRDNRLELVCLLVLLYGYFASVLAGVAPSAAVDASAMASKAAVVAYGLWRALPTRQEAAALARSLSALAGVVAADAGDDDTEDLATSADAKSDTEAALAGASDAERDGYRGLQMGRDAKVALLGAAATADGEA
jgi:hypothetical protein